MKKPWPKLAIVIVTFDRPKEIRLTIEALLKHLKYNGEVVFHLADDGTPGGYLPDIKNDFPGVQFTATKTDRMGWGVNVNKGILYQKADYIFLCEDDYVARKDIKINAGIALLESSPQLGIVRYDGVSGHVGINLWVRQAKTRLGILDFLEVNRKQSKHLNVYSNRPHLRHRRMHDKIGLYKEGLKLGETESEYAHRIKRAQECPEIALFPNYILRAFDHIGKTRQHTKHDK